MKYRRRFLALAGGLYILCALAQSSSALVLSGGMGNTAAPSSDPGWGNVARMTIGSGTYLGDGWVLAPYHVYDFNTAGSSYVDLDQRYYEVPGTARRIEYNSTTNTDLVMFRINGNPDLPMVQIGSVAPVGKEVTIISMGRDRVGDLVDLGGGYEGYCTTGVRTKRWGRNMTSPDTTSQSSSYGRTRALMTYFDADGLGYDECQAVANDSGASLFEEVSTGNWALAGMALSVGVPPGYQGPSVVYNAVYTNCTYYADLSVYRSQIDTIRLLPLPGDADWDGDVDNIDIDILFATFGQIGSGLQADFNHDDAVNLEDFSILREYFGMVSGGQVPGAEELPLRMVPEPASLILIVGCLPVLLRRRRNRG